MADLQEIIGRVIRRERLDSQLTIKELGDKAGLSEIYVGEIERGQKYPSSKVLESIAQALDLDLADLLELMAEEIRSERQPESVNAIGFTLPSTPGQPRRLVVKKIVNMLNEGEVARAVESGWVGLYGRPPCPLSCGLTSKPSPCQREQCRCPIYRALARALETLCAVGTPLHMKTGRNEMATSQREDFTGE